MRVLAGLAVAMLIAIGLMATGGCRPEAAAPPDAAMAAAAPSAPAAPDRAPKVAYPWLAHYDAGFDHAQPALSAVERAASSLAARVAPPAGYVRTAVEDGSFGQWLRHLPLKAAGAAVHLYDGRPSANQEAHAAVLDIDVGAKDLMQCADTVIRLRAEYLYSLKQFDAIHFNFTSGDRADFSRWAEGYRPVVGGSTVEWTKGAATGTGLASFRGYLDMVFTYAGTVSLAKELKAIEKVEDLAIGDVFIQPGSPGHAVMVVDLAQGGGKKAFLLAQGFMPAQEPHILKNPAQPAMSPWYAADFGETLRTPQWTFKRADLRRF